MTVLGCINHTEIILLSYIDSVGMPLLGCKDRVEIKLLRHVVDSVCAHE